MIKSFSILFAMLFFLQSTNIHFEDILKAKELLEHANLHKERYGDSFAMFISKHYGDLKESHKKQHNEEEKEHHHDPIHHDCAAQSHIDVLVTSFTYTLKSVKFIDCKETNFYYQNKFSTFEKQRVFQPPQLS